MSFSWGGMGASEIPVISSLPDAPKMSEALARALSQTTRPPIPAFAVRCLLDGILVA